MGIGAGHPPPKNARESDRCPVSVAIFSQPLTTLRAKSLKALRVQMIPRPGCSLATDHPGGQLWPARLAPPQSYIKLVVDVGLLTALEFSS